MKATGISGTALVAFASFLFAAAPAHAAKNGFITQLADPQGCVVNDPSTDITGCTNTGRGLDGAAGAATSPDGRSTYIASATSNAVTIFDRDPATGALTQKAGAAGCIVNGPSADITDCDNTGRGLAGAMSAAVSPDGKSVYVMGFDSDAVVNFDRDPATGALTQKAGATGCIVNEPSTDIVDCDNTGRGLADPVTVAVSPDSRSAYVASRTSSAIAIFDRNTAATGELTQKAGAAGCIVDEPSPDIATCDNTGRAISGALNVEVSFDGKSVYTTDGNGAIAIFDRNNAATGELTQKAGAAGCIVNEPSGDITGCDNTGRGLLVAAGLSVSPDGKSVYVTGFTSHAVAIFDRDPATGALTQKAGAAGCVVDGPSPDIAGCDNTGRALVNPVAVSTSPDAKSVYIGSAGSAAIAIFDRNTAATGELTHKAGAAGCIVDGPGVDIADCDNTGKALVFTGIVGQVRALVLSPSGASLYGAANGSDAVAAFARGTTPVCSDVESATTAPKAVAIQLACADADGDPVAYATTSNPARAVLSGLNPGAGTLTYTPKPFSSGLDAFTYAATADGELSNAAAAAVNVAAGAVISFRGGLRIRLDRRYRAPIQLTCSAGATSCDGKLSLKTASKVRPASAAGLADASKKRRKKSRKRRTLAVGSKSYSIAAGKRGTVKVGLNKGGRKLFRKSKRLSIRITLTQVVSGVTQTKTRTAKVLAPKKKKRKR